MSEDVADVNGKKLLYTQDDLELFKSYYMTNENCYAEQLPPNENNKARWNKVEGDKASFTKALISHFNGTRTIGSYTVMLSGEHQDCCKNCTFDFDLSISAREDISKIENPDDRKAALKRELDNLENLVREFTVFLNGIGLNNRQYLISFSGYKGYHVDIFFETPIPTKRVHDFANSLKKAAKLPENLEVFPKQAGVINAYGSLVKLPLGVHKLTGKRAKFIDLDDTDESSFGTPFDYLRRTQRLTLSDIEALSMEIVSDEINISAFSPNEEIVDLSQPPTCASLTKMLQSCNALKRLMAKAQKDHHLLHIERLAVLLLCIHFGDEGYNKIHEIIGHCSDYSKDETDKMIRHAKDQKKYKPMTCASMQENHICAKTCMEIISRDGKSPIKLAYPKSKVDIRMEFVEDVEKYQCSGKVISVPFKVDSLIGSSYTIPKEVHFKCSEACPARLSDKIPCEHNNKSGVSKYTVSENGMDALSCPDVSNAVLKKLLIGFAKIPCAKPQFMTMERKSDHKLQRIMISSADEIVRSSLLKNKATLETKSYVAFFNGDNINIATDYIGVGRVHPHPENQKTTFVLSHVERMMGSLDDFSPTPEQLAELEAYKKCDKKWLLNQLSAKASGVQKRERETLVVMMTLFSALQLEFNGRLLQRGWMETCFVGDSSQGKSALPENILKLIGINNRVAGGSTTIAGLIGGVGKHDDNQFISWGIMPNSDKTILFIDELQLLQQNQEALMALREIRSNGQAVITKIRKGSKPCRVRLIASANPNKGLEMHSFRRGCHAIATIMQPPDMRRFDIFQLFFQGEVPAEDALQENTNEKIEVSPKMLRTAVQWAWTRGYQDIKFTPEVTRAILSRSKQLINKYQAASGSYPMITLDTPDKFARMVAGLALFLMRTDDYIKVTPTLEDVEIVYNIIEQTYSSPMFGLDEEAADCHRRTNISPNWIEEFKLTMRLHNLPSAINLVEAITHISRLNKVRADELALCLRVNRSEISKLLQLLAVENILDSDFSGNYRTAPKMNKLIKILKEQSKSDAESELASAAEANTNSDLEGSVDDIFGESI